MPHVPPPAFADADPQLTPVSPEEIIEALSYALRYDERGRPRKTGGEAVTGLAAERLAEHLQRVGIVFMRRRPAPPHTAG